MRQLYSQNSPHGHHSITDSSLGPRDSQFLTVPTSLIWRLLYNGQSLGNLSITDNSVVLVQFDVNLVTILT